MNSSDSFGKSFKTNPKVRKFILRMASMFAGLAMALLIGEVVVRVVFEQEQIPIVYRGIFRLSDNPILGYELIPDLRAGGFAISSDGLRDFEYDHRKREDVFRIVVLGDSVTFGFLTHRDNTYVKRLEVLLNRYAAPGSPRFEVLNLGVTGYNVEQIVENLRVRGLQFDPDLVVYGYVLNDPQAYSLEADALAVLKRRAETGLSETFPSLLATSLSSSRLFSYVVARMRTKAWYKRNPRLNDPGFVAFENGTHREYFRKLHTEQEPLARLRNGLATLAQLTSTPEKIPVVLAIFPVHEGSGFSEYAFEDVHKKVLAASREVGIRSVDLTGSFAAAYNELDEGLYRDFLHPTDLGSRVAAMALFKSLSELDLLPTDSIDFARVTKWDEEDINLARVLGADR